jgi:hypothetical protein
LTIYGHDRELELKAINQGRRPGVIVDAGIAIGVEALSIGRFRRRRPRIEGMYDHRHPPGPDAIPFVQDSHGRYVWVSRPVAKPSRGGRRIASR